MSQVIIDLHSIGEQIVNAIKNSMENLGQQVIARAVEGKDDRQGRVSFDIREQILANARALYNIHITDRSDDNDQCETMDLVVYHSDDGVISEILYALDLHGLVNCHTYTFIKTCGSPSVGAALEKMLQMTMKMLEEEQDSLEVHPQTQAFKIKTKDFTGSYCISTG